LFSFSLDQYRLPVAEVDDERYRRLVNWMITDVSVHPQVALDALAMIDDVANGRPPFEEWSSENYEVSFTSDGLTFQNVWLPHDNGNYTVDPGEPITGTAVELVDRVDGSVTATAVSDAQGHVAFGSVPAGPYSVRVDGWRPAEDAADVAVGTCGNCGEDWALPYRR